MYVFHYFPPYMPFIQVKANPYSNFYPIRELNLSVSHGKTKTKIFNKKDVLLFPTVNFLFIDETFLCMSPSYGIFICQLIRFVRIFSDVLE